MVSLCLLENEEHDSKVVRKVYIGIFNIETFDVGRGRKPRAQASRIFLYFLKMITMEVLCYNREKRKENSEDRRERRGGKRASTVVSKSVSCVYLLGLSSLVYILSYVYPCQKVYLLSIFLSCLSLCHSSIMMEMGMCHFPNG